MAFMSGAEHFSVNGREIGLTMTDFWTWAYSDLTDCSQRSRLSEYIVASALKAHKLESRHSGFSGRPYYLLTEDGFRIAVQSAAYVQSQDPGRSDCISFSLSPSITGGPIRQGSDLSIFCLYKGMAETESPLDLDLWEFYVLKSSILAEKKPAQKTITLPSLMQLEPLWCDYHGIGEAVRAVINA